MRASGCLRLRDPARAAKVAAELQQLLEGPPYEVLDYRRVFGG